MPLTTAIAKVVLHATILARVKAEDRDTPTRSEAVRELGEKGVERAELLVHRDPDRLEHAGHRRAAFLVVHALGQCVFDHTTQAGGWLRSGLPRWPR